MELLVEKLTTTILVANVVEEFALSYGRFPPIQLINSLGNTKQCHKIQGVVLTFFKANAVLSKGVSWFKPT